MVWRRGGIDKSVANPKLSCAVLRKNSPGIDRKATFYDASPANPAVSGRHWIYNQSLHDRARNRHIAAASPDGHPFEGGHVPGTP